MKRAGWLGALCLLASQLADGQGAPVTSFWAHQFVDSVGVNTHLRHARSFYDTHFELMKQRFLIVPPETRPRARVGGGARV